MSHEPLLRVDVAMVAMGRATLTGGERAVFDVDPGEAVAIVGPHGSGKSTLLLFLAGMLSPIEGRVMVNGQDLATLGYDEMRKHRTRVGYVFEQGGFLSNRSVLENIALPLLYHRRSTIAPATVYMRARGLAAELGLDGGLDLVGVQAGARLQRIALFARALIFEPEILLVDGPNTSLSPRGSARIAAAIERRRRQRRMTVIYADHDASIAPFVAERQIVLFREHLSVYPAPPGAADDPEDATDESLS